MNKEDLDKILDPNDYSWIKVKKCNVGENEDIRLRDQKELVKMFNELRSHHKQETTFLINKCRELAKDLKG